jgi:hypothetical protein
MPISTNQELISLTRPPYADTNNQSLPVLEATLVEDSPVYDAFRLSDTQDDDMPSCLRKNHKIVIPVLGSVAFAATVAVVLLVFDESTRYPRTAQQCLNLGTPLMKLSMK